MGKFHAQTWQFRKSAVSWKVLTIEPKQAEFRPPWVQRVHVQLYEQPLHSLLSFISKLTCRSENLQILFSISSLTGYRLPYRFTTHSG